MLHVPEQTLKVVFRRQTRGLQTAALTNNGTIKSKPAETQVFNGTAATGLAGGILYYKVSDQYTAVRRGEESSI